MSIRVVLADDHLIVREGVRRLLETQHDLDAGLGAEEPLDTLADDQVIICEDDPDRHGRRIRRCSSR